MKNSIDSACEILAFQREIERLTADRDKLKARVEEYRRQITANTAQEQGNLEKVVVKTAKRAVEVCERMAYRFEIGDECFDCANALRAEFGLDKGE